LGQIFISDTHEDRITAALEKSSMPYEIFNIGG